VRAREVIRVLNLVGNPNPKKINGQSSLINKSSICLIAKVTWWSGCEVKKSMSKDVSGVDLSAQLEEACLQIIALAGDSKSKVYEALKAAINGDHSAAEELLTTAEEQIVQARRLQQNLLTNEAKGNGTKLSILLTHAMDILVTADSEKNLAGYMLMLCASMNNKGD